MSLSWAKTGVDSGYRLVAPIDVEIVVDESRRWSLRVEDREPVRLGRRPSFDDAESKLIELLTTPRMETRMLALHWVSRTRNGGPIEISPEERTSLLAEIRGLMWAQRHLLLASTAEIDRRRAAKGMPPLEREVSTEAMVLAVGIVYGLVPSKPMLSEAELTPVRSLCEAAGFPT